MPVSGLEVCFYPCLHRAKCIYHFKRHLPVPVQAHACPAHACPSQTRPCALQVATAVQG